MEGDLSLEAFSLGTPALQTDVARITRLHAAALASWRPDRVEIERSSFDCELGGASLSGTLPRDAKGGWSLPAFLHQRHELSGRVDVARLARLLPATLRLRHEVEINAGQVQWTLSGHPATEGMRWHGQLEASHLTATAAGRPIAWERPVLLSFDAHETADGPVVEGLRCEADFLKILASGTPEALAAQWRCNLEQLSSQVGQFVDLARSNARAKDGATSTGNTRRNGRSKPTVKCVCTTSDWRWEMGRRGAKMICWPPFPPKDRPSTPRSCGSTRPP